MKSEKHQSNASFIQDGESVMSPLLPFDLPALVQMLKFSNSWEMGELCSTVLLKSPGKQIVLAAIPEGTEITSKKSGDPITLQVIEGSLMLKTRNEKRPLFKGHLLTLNENTKFQLASKQESVLLITVGANTMAPEYN